MKKINKLLTHHYTFFLIRLLQKFQIRCIVYEDWFCHLKRFNDRACCPLIFYSSVNNLFQVDNDVNCIILF